jgi:hypothetical protein
VWLEVGSTFTYCIRSGHTLLGYSAAFRPTFPSHRIQPLCFRAAHCHCFTYLRALQLFVLNSSSFLISFPSRFSLPYHTYRKSKKTTTRHVTYLVVGSHFESFGIYLCFYIVSFDGHLRIYQPHRPSNCTFLIRESTCVQRF